ncbi:regulator of chromosome condensation 1/beta-lactamase-inhibitor protein II [Armillaria fumosa]|nr:regulator of chromosome condensation 1/beta-lactamase-inhibitor protein II [Armillaria fumosa]
MASSSTTGDKTEPEWGRVLICGGTAWTKLGRKGPASPDDGEDLLEPHILRSLSTIRVVSIHTSCSAVHFVAIDVDGAAWLFGRNGSSCLGLGGGVDTVSEEEPLRIAVNDLGGDGKWVHAACGRNHTLLVASDGTVWTAGTNMLGQCGHSPCPEIPFFKRIPFFGTEEGQEKAVKASAGVTFSCVLTESGKVYAFGSGEKGQLGNGTTGERITTGNKTAFDIIYEPVLVKDLGPEKITQLSSGQQHSIALDEKGTVHVWGYNGYCRLGLGNQVDALRPKQVPQFTGANAGVLVAAGPSNSVVVDKGGMYWMTGKWKNSGDGSSGSPYSSFRYMPDIMGCKITAAASGGVTHWALTPDDDSDGVMTISWGQNAANGELGLGPEEPKSATKPIKHAKLGGLDVLSVAPGQNTTLFLVRPSDKMSDLPRHPVEVEVSDACLICRKEDEEEALECDKCDNPYHLLCLTPPLTTVPEGEWFCPECIRASVGRRLKHDGDSGKRKVPPSSGGRAGAPKKKKQ